MSENPDYGYIITTPLGGGSDKREISGSWCRGCYGEDGDHEPGCGKQN